MRAKLSWLAVFILIPALSTQVLAEQIKIPVGQQAEGNSISMPQTGMKKNEVEKTYGAPLEKTAPIGNPPISSWKYPELIVYFEYNHVIHSVKAFHPTIDNKK